MRVMLQYLGNAFPDEALAPPLGSMQGARLCYTACGWTWAKFAVPARIRRSVFELTLS